MGPFEVKPVPGKGEGVFALEDDRLWKAQDERYIASLVHQAPVPLTPPTIEPVAAAEELEASLRSLVTDFRASTDLSPRACCARRDTEAGDEREASQDRAGPHPRPRTWAGRLIAMAFAFIIARWQDLP